MEVSYRTKPGCGRAVHHGRQESAMLHVHTDSWLVIRWLKIFFMTLHNSSNS